ncbi:MAG: DMT family transporter [Flavobacteriaceae bacterium]|jgi:drug/metabolite transporter (DMT)-like permease
MNKRNLAFIAALIATSIFGFNHTIAKELMPYFISPSALLYVRVLGATILFWTISLFFPNEYIKKKDRIRLVLCALFGMSINMIASLKGLSLTTPINSAIISTTSPIIIFIISIILIKEKITKQKYIGVIIGFLGTLFLILFNNKIIVNAPNIKLGNIFIFANSISYGLYYVLVKPLTEKYSMITLMKWLFLISIIINAPISFTEFINIQWQNFVPSALINLLYVVICTTFLVYLLNLYALKNLKATTVGMFIYFQPVIAIIYAIYVGSDKLSILDVVSVLMVLLGVYLVSKKTLKK